MCLSRIPGNCSFATRADSEAIGKANAGTAIEAGMDARRVCGSRGPPPDAGGAFETGRMNITLASLHLVAQTLGVRIIDLLKGVED